MLEKMHFGHKTVISIWPGLEIRINLEHPEST